MQTHFLFDLMAAYAPYQRIEAHAKEQGAVIAASGMTRAQKIHLACTLAVRTGRPLLYLCDSERAAGSVTEDITALLGGGVSQMPARDITFYQDVAASRDVAYRRIETMRRMKIGRAHV